MNAPMPATVVSTSARASRQNEVVAALAPRVAPHPKQLQPEDTVPNECDGRTA